jgi:hypothetical protein
MGISASIVLTTIYDPVALDDYYRNLKKFDRLSDVGVYMIPDLKTPDSAYKRCEKLQKKGLNVVCPAVVEQEEFLRKVGFDPHLVPCNSDNRRNVGFLMALESGADLIISIDDDNYCSEDEDFIACHEVVCGGRHTADVVSSQTGWYNICGLLNFAPQVKTYPRGFPYYARHKKEQLDIVQDGVTIHLNAGLWLQDPDIDGISWLVNPAKAISFRGKSPVLAQDTWTPINTQNTAMRRNVVCCYYYLKMGYPMGEMTIDRFGDIYSGYFSQACVKAMKGSIRVGTPIAQHNRHAHNFFNDAANEWGGIMVLEELLPWLTKEAQLDGSTYAETYVCLSEILQENVERFNGKIWNDATRAYFHQMAYYMRKWAQVCKKLI